MTRGLVATSVGVAGLFSAMAAWAQPGSAKATQTSSAAGATSGTFSPPAAQPAATPTTQPTATQPTDPQPTDPTSGDGGNATAPLSPPTTLPAPVYQYTPPAPVYQYNPPPVVSGAS